MEEIFVVQKRPVEPTPPLNDQLGNDGFYYRIVNVRTAQAVSGKVLSADEARAECQRLNEVARTD